MVIISHNFRYSAGGVREPAPLRSTTHPAGRPAHYRARAAISPVSSLYFAAPRRAAAAAAHVHGGARMRATVELSAADLSQCTVCYLTPVDSLC